MQGCKCTVGGRIGWIVTRSGTARRPGILGTTTAAEENGATRTSAYQVEQLRHDNSERARLLDIESGMRVPLTAGFVPNGTGERTPLRPAYVEVRMLVDLHAQGLGFRLPRTEAIAFTASGEGVVDAQERGGVGAEHRRYVVLRR